MSNSCARHSFLFDARHWSKLRQCISRRPANDPVRPLVCGMYGMWLSNRAEHLQGNPLFAQAPPFAQAPRGSLRAMSRVMCHVLLPPFIFSFLRKHPRGCLGLPYTTKKECLYKRGGVVSLPCPSCTRIPFPAARPLVPPELRGGPAPGGAHRVYPRDRDPRPRLRLSPDCLFAPASIYPVSKRLHLCCTFFQTLFFKWFHPIFRTLTRLPRRSFFSGAVPPSRR